MRNFPRAEEDGFTLIELLVVIIVLGIFAVVAIPNYMDIQSEAKIAAVKGRLAAIRGGIELMHAKILTSGVNTGPDGDNPDWPTLEEVRANELFLSTRPESIKYRQIVRTSETKSNEVNKALPLCLLPDMEPGMSANPSGVTSRSLSDIQTNPPVANESSGWAYYPGNERDANGHVVPAFFYVNDDRPLTDNVDGADRVPSQW